MMAMPMPTATKFAVEARQDVGDESLVGEYALEPSRSATRETAGAVFFLCGVSMKRD